MVITFFRKNSNRAKSLEIGTTFYLFENPNVQYMQLCYITQKQQRTALDDLKGPRFNFNLSKVYLLRKRGQVDKEFSINLQKLENCI